MLDTILLFVFVLFAVLGFFVSAVFVLLKASAPKGKDRFFLVAFRTPGDREYMLKIRWLDTVLGVTGLAARITLVAADENADENGFSEIEEEFSGRKNIIILRKQ